MRSSKPARRPNMRRHALNAAAVAFCAAACGNAGAFDIDVGNDDVQLRFDNTIRYNLGRRIEGQDPLIINSVNNNDGDLNFGGHSTINNRIDLLTEADIVYKK